ncbi:hypothetical protein SprV_0602100700 [Sparganum proliferum]
MARPQDTALARFCGLPKVYKVGAPLRPIVSLKGTPTYGLAKWLFRLLKFLTVESDTTVSSSAQFLGKLKGDLAIETIELLLQSKYDETENRLGRAYVLLLLKFCHRTYFTFDRTIHEQVKGTSMGSPISRFIAEAVLQRLDSLVFQHHKPKFWARYVDDTFVVVDRNQLLTVKVRLNAVFPDIQFTMEEEENKQLAFLDVLSGIDRSADTTRISSTPTLPNSSLTQSHSAPTSTTSITPSAHTVHPPRSAPPTPFRPMRPPPPPTPPPPTPPSPTSPTTTAPSTRTLTRLRSP